MLANETRDTIAGYFSYLDKLRNGATVNMFYAAPCIQRKFGVSKEAAQEILLAWMKTFGGGSLSPLRRAENYVAETEIEFRQHQNGETEILDHQKEQRSVYGIEENDEYL